MRTSLVEGRTFPSGFLVVFFFLLDFLCSLVTFSLIAATTYSKLFWVLATACLLLVIFLENEGDCVQVSQS